MGAASFHGFYRFVLRVTLKYKFKIREGLYPTEAQSSARALFQEWWKQASKLAVGFD